MTSYINRFNENKNTIMSLRINDEQLFKKYNKMWNKVEKLMRIYFESKPTYGYDDTYIKTKICRHMQTLQLQIFIIKKCQKKNYHVNVYQ